MFDIGFWEVLVIAALGLMILGPERLPRVVGQLGRWLRQARRTASQLRWQIEHELDLSDRREAERKRREQPPKTPVDADGSGGEAPAPTPAARRAEPHGDELHGGDLHGGDLHGGDLHGGELPGGELPEAPAVSTSTAESPRANGDDGQEPAGAQDPPARP